MSGNPRGRYLILLLLAWFGGFLAYLFWPESEITHAPGILVEEEPQQRLTKNPRFWEKDGYVITPLAEFEAKARVLHVMRYSRGRESDLSPVDLALGWGPMSDQQVLDQISITQSGRWYEWHAKTLPVPRNVITASSANMHIIPAGNDVEETLESIRKGDIIRLTGYLVEVRAQDGWGWRSSLTRTDDGNGSCELVWVQQVFVQE